MKFHLDQAMEYVAKSGGRKRYRFKKGTVPILVSTMGVGGKDLDFQGVDCLIFWGMPESLEQYKRCLGRVGRLVPYFLPKLVNIAYRWNSASEILRKRLS